MKDEEKDTTPTASTLGEPGEQQMQLANVSAQVDFISEINDLLTQAQHIAKGERDEDEGFDTLYNAADEAQAMLNRLAAMLTPAAHPAPTVAARGAAETGGEWTKEFEPQWVYLSSGELPPLKDEGYGEPFRSKTLLLTVQTPGHTWVTTGGRNLNCPNGWDCGDVELAPEVRTLTAWAYPDTRPKRVIPPAARIELPAAPTEATSHASKGGQHA